MASSRRDSLRISALAGTLLLVLKFRHALDRGPGLARLGDATDARRLVNARAGVNGLPYRLQS